MAATAASVEQASGTSSLAIEAALIDDSCVGSRWVAANLDRLAQLIAIIAMGQAVHAARVIGDLSPAAPALNLAALRTDAKRRLSVSGETPEQREASRWHRDGLLFEAISWIAAMQSTGGEALLKDPHLSSTTPGLDGLMIELDEARTAVARATIFEAKCSEHPRTKFRDEIMPAFKAHHGNGRASELVAIASTLIERSGLDGTAATIAAARVLEKAFRTYHASLTILEADDSQERRKALFKGYDELDGIGAEQRVGATLVVEGDLRPWFDELAARGVAHIDSLDDGAA